MPEMTDDDGYTLAEVLVAIVLIGLMIAGLTQAARLIGRGQAAATRYSASSRAARGLQSNFAQLLTDAGPFPSDQKDVFQGDQQSFRFACGLKNSCGAWISTKTGETTLHIASKNGSQETFDLGVGAAQFFYAGSGGTQTVWPSDEKDRQTLSSVGLMLRTADGDVPIATSRVWREQDANCQFDLIALTCRASAPQGP